ncbi:28S ribosomal protein S24, mitochondrial isoform X1 [Pieris brassicae]|uniref:28S ribosomal protein S24, mitochondrial isoform X1 n=1 Tax=Pieris brassicae TaxID=7116 RepID=UPI001E65E8E8|nr:28S ribosomal protein S24, mitochondrial isoform X1 [Pieris brassicae]
MNFSVIKLAQVNLIQNASIITKNAPLLASQFHTSTALCRVVSGKYRITKRRDKPLTYEMANPPHYIAHRKTWNSWNTSNLKDGVRRSETALEDEFIRRFMNGTWHGLVCSEIIIKRQFNHIRVAAIIRRAVSPTKMYFLLGYSEELMANWLQCPVTLELQTVDSFKDVVFKYI